MKALGLNDGYLSTACLIEDGAVTALASEERFNRRKNYGGPPEQAVDWILQSTGTDPAEIRHVVLVGRLEPIKGIESFATARHKYFSWLAAIAPPALVGSRRLLSGYVRWREHERRRLAGIASLLAKHGIQHRQVALQDHHEAHACAAYFAAGAHRCSGQTLVITADGSGDGLCATVSLGEGQRLRRLAATSSYHSPGILYSRVTQYLGMRPLDHEYKVMGLAPYAPDDCAERAYAVLRRYLSLSPDGLEFVNHSHSWGNSLLLRLQRDLFLHRFDGIAAGVQRLIEELFVAFVVNWSRFTGVRRVVLGGGIFMNVKLNMLLAERPELESVYFMPSGGDDSIAIGAAYRGYLRLARTVPGAPAPAPLTSLYLGNEISDAEAEAALVERAKHFEWTRHEDIERVAAELIADHKIVGRVAGRMEWGARALGNRSILAHPSDLRNVRRLNAAIKMRDYWMPFAPSLLYERRHDYTENPRNLDAPTMTQAFRSTPLAQRELGAALHPSDLTCRPQFVRADQNPRYHHLLACFQELTGIGGVLNTSLNLHGEPIVCSAGDALNTLLNSGLDHLTLGQYLVSKRDPE